MSHLYNNPPPPRHGKTSIFCMRGISNLVMTLYEIITVNCVLVQNTQDIIIVVTHNVNNDNIKIFRFSSHKISIILATPAKRLYYITCNVEIVQFWMPRSYVNFHRVWLLRFIYTTGIRTRKPWLFSTFVLFMSNQ